MVKTTENHRLFTRILHSFLDLFDSILVYSFSESKRIFKKAKAAFDFFRKPPSFLQFIQIVPDSIFEKAPTSTALFAATGNLYKQIPTAVSQFLSASHLSEKKSALFREPALARKKPLHPGERHPLSPTHSHPPPCDEDRLRKGHRCRGTT